VDGPSQNCFRQSYSTFLDAAVNNKASNTINKAHVQPISASISYRNFSGTSISAFAQQDAPKAVVAVVGDADRFTIGQEDFVGERTEIASPSAKAIPHSSNKQTFFYIQSRIHGNMVTYTCEGDFSLCRSRMLHIIRYSMADNHCKLEMFESEPGGEPVPADVRREESQNCLFK
jgi:hypothetical protein